MGTVTQDFGSVPSHPEILSSTAKQLDNVSNDAKQMDNAATATAQVKMALNALERKNGANQKWGQLTVAWSRLGSSLGPVLPLQKNTSKIWKQINATWFPQLFNVACGYTQTSKTLGKPKNHPAHPKTRQTLRCRVTKTKRIDKLVTVDHSSCLEQLYVGSSQTSWSVAYQPCLGESTQSGAGIKSPSPRAPQNAILQDSDKK
eukprot:6012987-Amphidinium_carterae.1